ncbi:F-type H+-transporting ATPase subunit delta [Ferrithrix thermotolerans DSM 19514]|uniref:ATP synthase subunit delta n=1 Tax=Ferrithrix thermotolerans DSM 19514 TaxID=1121881 RepID=A0A1M4VA58_9ACTN|nr:ATP synthase F1 subunit delta [Ferrithrix thermotolerans]SHE65881.1 F-type H+-transporting ATPase subunit delta [Ferrithrix thermotolerans DSM 19514]
MREWILGYALGVRAIAQSTEVLGTVRGDVDSAVSVIESSDELLSVLSDASYQPADRASLVRDIFAGRVRSALAVELLAEAVREEVPGDLKHTLRDLPPIFSSEFQPDKIGFSSTRKRVEGYALARVRLGGDAVDLERCENDIFAVARTIEKIGSLRRILSGVGSNALLRSQLVTDLFERRVCQVALELLNFAVQTSRVRDIVELLDDLVALLSAERGKTIADVRSARELSESAKSSLLDVLQGITARNLELRDRVQPDLVAGVVALVGDTLFDVSARRRLEEVRSLVADAVH